MNMYVYICLYMKMHTQRQVYKSVMLEMHIYRYYNRVYSHI